MTVDRLFIFSYVGCRFSRRTVHHGDDWLASSTSSDVLQQFSFFTIKDTN